MSIGVLKHSIFCGEKLAECLLRLNKTKRLSHRSQNRLTIKLTNGIVFMTIVVRNFIKRFNLIYPHIPNFILYQTQHQFPCNIKIFIIVTKLAMVKFINVCMRI